MVNILNSCPTLAPFQGVSSTALRMVSVGQAPPDFKLNNQNGKPVSLSSFKNKKKVVVRNRDKDTHTLHIYYRRISSVKSGIYLLLLE